MTIGTRPRSTPASVTKSPPIRRTLSVSETATLLGLPEITIRRMAYRGELASVKAGTRLLILRSAVECLLGEEVRDAGC